MVCCLQVWDRSWDRWSRTSPMTVPDVVPWDQFLATRFLWRQGEHVSLIGRTGGGKSTLALAITPKRKYVAVLGTKPRDSTLSGLLKNGEGWRRMPTWNPHRQDT